MVLLASALIAASGSGLMSAAVGAPQILPMPVATVLLAAPAAPVGTGSVGTGVGDGGTTSPPSQPAAAQPAPEQPPVSQAPAALAPAPAGVGGATTSTSGAATAGTSPDESSPADAPPPHDPWEKTNRSIFAFDTALDKHFMGPVARGYSAALPFVVRHHLSLVIANLDEPMTIGNDLLQLRMDAFGKSLMRFTLNSTIGLAGIFDFASHHKLEHHTADFGQTLGRWGAKPGPYVMLPLLGPSGLRDGIGRAVDLVGDPVSWVLGGILSTFGASREGGELVDGRAQAEPAMRAIYDSTDPYAAARSGYMQARAAAVREATGKAEVLPDFDGL